MDEVPRKPGLPIVEAMHQIQLAHPTWTVRYEGAGLLYSARPPTYRQDGIVVEGKTAAEVIIRIVEYRIRQDPSPSEEPSGISPSAPATRSNDQQPDDPALAVAKVGGSSSLVSRLTDAGFTGSSCDFCQGLHMVRTGTCETCQDCGRTSGCG